MKKAEVTFYFVVWTTSVLYALWRFINSASYSYQLLNRGDFINGWSVLHKKKDVSDSEWSIFVRAFKEYWPWVLTQIFLSQFIFSSWPQCLPLFYCIYSIIFLVKSIGPIAATFYVGFVLLMFIIHLTGRRLLCFSMTLFLLFMLHQPLFLQFRETVIKGEVQGFLAEVGIAWLNARCLSFSLDRINNFSYRYWKMKDIIVIMAYCFYIPVLFTGPILTYSSFKDQLGCHQRWTPEKILKALAQIFRYLWWYSVLEFLLHFIYSTSIQFYPELVERFDTWTLCGLGYALPVTFYLKYLVVYGLGKSFAKMEKFDFPPPPKCITRIHLCSDLWRHFDRGLHLWISEYIYRPLVGCKWTTLRRILASSACFAFICLWHGMDKAVCMWSALNFFGIASEMIASAAFGKFCRSRHVYMNFSNNSQRLHCLLAAPHFMGVCISSVFFLSNWDVGWCFIRKIILGGIIPLLPTAFIMYCGCQVSVELKKWEDKRSHRTGSAA